MDILQSTVQHQKHQVVHYFAVLSEIQVGFKTLGLENFEILVLNTSHCVNHFLSYFDGRRVGLGVSPQDESKVNVQHFS